MKFATLKNSTRDGQLLVVSRDQHHAVMVNDIASTLLEAIENWDDCHLALQAIYDKLNVGKMPGAFTFDATKTAAPLPRAPQWCDGSAFLNHSRLMQKAYNLPPIPEAELIPLMYQGASDDFLSAHDPILLPDESHDIDFEGEYGVIVDDVPMGCPASHAFQHIKLIVQINDVSLRAFGPREMLTGFGFLHAKPSSSFAPIAITPDELGNDWHNGRVCLPLHVAYNGKWFGHPNGAHMNFGFHELIAHAAHTRKLSAGTIIGSGTVSDSDPKAGSACIAEQRAIETIESGQPATPFMRFGDRVTMKARQSDGALPFGIIDQCIGQAVHMPRERVAE